MYCRVDGNLFINLSDGDWVDMGITNKFHTRKLQLILRGYRLRHQLVKNRGLDDSTIEEEDADDEEVGSEYSPSELSAAIAAEGRDLDEDDLDDDDRDEVRDAPLHCLLLTRWNNRCGRVGRV